MIGFIRPRLLLVTVLAGFTAGPLAGQDHQSAIGLTVGGSIHGDLLRNRDPEIRFKTGWVAGLQGEYWFGDGRMGVRVNSLYTQRELDTGAAYNVFMNDVDFMVRLLEPDYRRTYYPFVAVGLGATHWAGVGGTQPLGNGAYGDYPVRLHVLASAGVDVASSATTGLRFEVGDQIVFPSIGYSPPSSGLPNVHNLVATAVLQLRMGRLVGQPTRQPVRPAPVVQEAPRPEPRQPPAAERDTAMAELQSRVTSLNREITRLELWIEELQDRLDREPAPVVAGAGVTLYTVQVGAFLDPDRADQLVARVRSSGIPVWRDDAVARGMTFSRVRAGALVSEAQAERLAALLQRQQGLPVWVDDIDPDETIPAGAVAATRRYLEQSGG
jgi:hypothetical protein